MSQRNELPLSNVILTVFLLSLFIALSGRFECINDACVSCVRVFTWLVLQVSSNVVTVRNMHGVANSSGNSGISNVSRALFVVSSNFTPFGWD